MENQNEYIARVRNGYVPQEHTKLDELKALDRKARMPALIFAYIFGSVAALVLGVGMCLAMKVIGTSVLSDTVLMTVGVIVGCVGIALCIVNYYIYKAVLTSRKRKYGTRIVALGNELLNEGQGTEK